MLAQFQKSAPICTFRCYICFLWLNVVYIAQQCNSKFGWRYSKEEKFLHWQARMPAAPPRGLAPSPYMQSETTKRWVGEKRAGGVLLPAE